jgi:hypothetical protein
VEVRRTRRAASGGPERTVGRDRLTVPLVIAVAATGVYGGYFGAAQGVLLLVILGIFLGGLGVHRFYLGYTNIGIIQIIVTVVTCGLGSIWGLVEGIMILARSQGFLPDADGVPLTD